MQKIIKPEILKRETVAKTQHFSVESLQLRFSNGVERTYERMAGPGRDSVMIVPITDDNKAILIREYAAGTHCYETGFAKGLVDKGETPEQAANRELMEEVGFAANKLILLKTVTMSPGYFGGRMHLFLALDLYPQTAQGDEPEPLLPFKVDLADIDELISSDELREARSITAILLAQRYLKSRGS